jgi:hypothetical protein
MHRSRGESLGAVFRGDVMRQPGLSYDRTMAINREDIMTAGPVKDGL